MHVQPVRVGSSVAYAPLHPFCGYKLLRPIVVPPDSGRALVVGKLDSVYSGGGGALRFVVCDAQIQVLPAAR